MILLISVLPCSSSVKTEAVEVAAEDQAQSVQEEVRILLRSSSSCAGLCLGCYGYKTLNLHPFFHFVPGL